MHLERIFRRLPGAAVFVIDPDEHNNLLRIAGDSAFRVFAIDALQATSKQELLRAFADSFGFPDYFGYNWDALEECIRDLAWLPRCNFLLVFQNADSLLDLGAKDFAILTAILGEATSTWRAEGIVFSVVLLGGAKLAATLEDIFKKSR
jgi:RNAse (barnase) inhibitor barstar